MADTNFYGINGDRNRVANILFTSHLFEYQSMVRSCGFMKRPFRA
jgi:hypothetical protein